MTHLYTEVIAAREAEELMGYIILFLCLYLVGRSAIELIWHPRETWRKFMGYE